MVKQGFLSDASIRAICPENEPMSFQFAQMLSPTYRPLLPGIKTPREVRVAGRGNSLIDTAVAYAAATGKNPNLMVSDFMMQAKQEEKPMERQRITPIVINTNPVSLLSVALSPPPQAVEYQERPAIASTMQISSEPTGQTAPVASTDPTGQTAPVASTTPTTTMSAPEPTAPTQQEMEKVPARFRGIDKDKKKQEDRPFRGEGGAYGGAYRRGNDEDDTGMTTKEEL